MPPIEQYNASRAFNQGFPENSVIRTEISREITACTKLVLQTSLPSGRISGSFELPAEVLESEGPREKLDREGSSFTSSAGLFFGIIKCTTQSEVHGSTRNRSPQTPAAVQRLLRGADSRVGAYFENKHQLPGSGDWPRNLIQRRGIRLSIRSTRETNRFVLTSKNGSR